MQESSKSLLEHMEDNGVSSIKTMGTPLRTVQSQRIKLNGQWDKASLISTLLTADEAKVEKAARIKGDEAVKAMENNP